MDNYSALEKVFHHVVLGFDATGEALFDLERKKYARQSAAPHDAVFVCGLARAGTTALMRALHDSSHFASLTYRDMPCVMAPNLWHAISSFAHKKSQTQERAHGDGVMVDFDSPEALDEVFWRVFCADSYIRPDALVAHTVADDILEKFKTYMGLICARHDRGRYLSKNNNNILRLASLSKGLPDATFLIPFRHPLDQAESLLRQHKRFKNGHAFQKKYMTWLVHHEFGDTHRPFNLQSIHTISDGDLNSLSYWLDLWCRTYEALADTIEHGAENLVPVCYENLCNDETVWKRISQKLNLPASSAFPFTPRPIRIQADEDAKRLERAMSIYAKMNTLAHDRLS